MTKITKISRVVALLLILVMVFATFASCKIVIKKTKKVTASTNATTTTTTSGNGGVNPDPDVPMVDPIDDNYRTLYEIYVRSFADGSGDGVGDIRGIIETFDYLNDGDINSGRDLGVQAIWLTPIFYGNSDHKYDAIDFYSIDPEFGTMEDFEELVKLCDERNVKLILDLALNHTSTSCNWFKESKKARINGDTSNKYYNYYNWSTTAKAGYVKLSGYNLWYECWFDTEGGSMPELNYDNQAVRNEMLNVAKYWMDLGVDGFRFDAVKYIYYEDHTKSPQFYNWYTGELRKLNPDIYLIGECWDDQGTILKYYTAMNCFNFPMAGNNSLASAAKGTGNMSTFVDGVIGMQNAINRVNSNGMLSMFLSNHDQDRSAGFIASDNQRKMAASLYLLTPGTPVIYYGEEIGLRGSGDSPNDANRRLPFKWGDDWTCKIPNGASYSIDLWDNTADDQRKDSDSLLNHYIDVLAIRNKYPAIARGTYSAIYAGKVTLGGFQITYQGQKMMILHNTSTTETVTIDLKSLSALSGYTSFELLDFVGVNSASINGTTLTLGAQTTVIFK